MDPHSSLKSRKTRMLMFALGSNLMAYSLGRLLTQNRVHLDLTLRIDGVIPFLPWTVIIYLGCYLFWALNYVLAVQTSAADADRFILAHGIGETVSFAVFILLPTTMVRPEITGTSLWEQVVKLLYSVDEADNLLPSLHCYISWMCWIGVRKHSRIPGWYRVLSLVLALAVCISTLTVKQHAFVDVPAGILLAELSFAAAGGLKKRRIRSVR